MKILFICNQNQNRSKTAEEIFRNRFETKSAGLYNNKPLTEKQLSWPDIVVVMEDEQRKEVGKRFPSQYLKKKIISLGIADIYHFNQPELVRILKAKIEELF